MNPIVLGLGGAFFVTLGFAAGVALAPLAMACIDDDANTATISKPRVMTVAVSDSIPCP